MSRPAVPLYSRFIAKVDVNPITGCWDWLGALSHNGYARIRDGTKIRKASRVSLELVNRMIPINMEPDHLCKNHGCVNPEHLDIVTHQINCARRGTTHTPIRVLGGICKNNHSLVDGNISYRRDSISVKCLTCERERGKRRYYAVR